MEPKELRIGNWVMGNRAYQITLSRLISLAVSESNGQQYANPIPLTEEWLLKFGAVDNSDIEVKRYYFKVGFRKYENQWIEFEFNESGKMRSSIQQSNETDGADYFTEIESNIQYVHSLQNLYFALTGQEL